MSKLKTKSSAKKRFMVTGRGKVLAAQSGKRHGMIKRTPKQIRQKRGTTTMADADDNNSISRALPLCGGYAGRMNGPRLETLRTVPRPHRPVPRQ